MAKKRKARALPRVTVLGYSRRELAEFSQAVERLGLYVEELRLLLDRKKGQTKVTLPPIPPTLPPIPGAAI